MYCHSLPDKGAIIPESSGIKDEPQTSEGFSSNPSVTATLREGSPGRGEGLRARRGAADGAPGQPGGRGGAEEG